MHATTTLQKQVITQSIPGRQLTAKRKQSEEISMTGETTIIALSNFVRHKIISH